MKFVIVDKSGETQIINAKNILELTCNWLCRSEIDFSEDIISIIKLPED